MFLFLPFSGVLNFDKFSNFQGKLKKIGKTFFLQIFTVDHTHIKAGSGPMKVFLSGIFRLKGILIPVLITAFFLAANVYKEK